MIALLIGLAALVAPGFAHGLMSQVRAMWIVFGAVTVAYALTAVTVWAAPVVVVLWLGSMVHAVVRYRRLRPRPQWSWVWPVVAFGSTLALALALRGFAVEAFKIPASSGYPTLEIGDHIFVDKLSPRWRSPERGEVIVFAQPCEPRDYIKRVIALGGDTVEMRCSAVYINGTRLPETLVTATDRHRDADHGPGPTEWFEREVSRYRETSGDHTYDTFYSADRPRRSAGVGSEHDFPTLELRNCRNPGSGMPAGVAAPQAPGEIVTTGPEVEPCKPHRHYVVPADHVFVLGDNRDNSNDSRYWGSVPLANVKGRARGIWWPPGRFGAIE